MTPLGKSSKVPKFATLTLNSMEYFPIFVDLRNRPVLVVGGGNVAARKVSLLRAAGAVVRVVALDFCPEIETAEGESVELHRRAFAPDDLEGVHLVVAATNQAAVNREVSESARAKPVPVNVVDAPELCSFITPSIVDRSPLVIAISSGGNSPVLARLIRQKLEGLVPSGYSRLAKLAREYRQQAKDRLTGLTQRRRFWEAVLEGPIAERAMNGDESGARRMIEQRLLESNDAPVEPGEVYLVGGGPGDPDLLTFKALRLMQQADVVVYDRLIAPAVLDKVRRDAERIYVGKAADQHTIPQEEINELLVKLARAGNRVVRLKGGDPFVFGRGGEEIETLRQAGIAFQVVPGITAALGCSSYAGIPLTHRDYAHACLFVTGHLKDGSLSLPWTSMVQSSQTVVVYMGLGALPQLCSKLVEHGLPGDWPTALVYQGTTENQRVLVGTLETITEKARAAALKAPVLVIVGEVVTLRDQLAWYHGPQQDDLETRQVAGSGV